MQRYDRLLVFFLTKTLTVIEGNAHYLICFLTGSSGYLASKQRFVMAGSASTTRSPGFKSNNVLY